jgi:hypothetical protein
VGVTEQVLTERPAVELDLPLRAGVDGEFTGGRSVGDHIVGFGPIDYRRTDPIVVGCLALVRLTMSYEKPAFPLAAAAEDSATAAVLSLLEALIEAGGKTNERAVVGWYERRTAAVRPGNSSGTPDDW